MGLYEVLRLNQKKRAVDENFRCFILVSVFNGI